MTVKDIQQLTSIDINKLSEEELKIVSNQFFSAMNKRIRRIEAQGEGNVAAVRFLAEERKTESPRFSTRGKTGKELQSELARAIQFSQDKTGTISGIKSLKKKYFNETLGIDVPEDDKEFWSEYRKFLDEYSHIANSKNFDSKQAQRLVAREYKQAPDERDYESIAQESTKKVKKSDYDW